MSPLDVVYCRLRNQRLTGASFEHPEEAVSWLGAVQAQDYGGAKWGIAQRARGATDLQIDRLFDAGAILRTHVMRPTWHFVAPADIRWLLALTSPRVHAVNAYQYRKLELDDALFERSNAVLVASLQGGHQRMRAELAGALERAGISARGLRLAYLIMRAELDAVICSGARRGKQFTYALLEERVPPARRLTRDQALAKLVARYFISHGPALVHDFAWWSGLTVADTRAGIALAGSCLASEILNGKTYWFAPSPASQKEARSTVHLLPNYDEYLVSYREYFPAFDPSRLTMPTSLDSPLAGHILVVDGHVLGGWRRTLKKNETLIEVQLLAPLNAAQAAAMHAAAERYGRFIGIPATLVVRT